MKMADSFLTTVDPLTKKPLSQKSVRSTWRSLTHGILINAGRVLKSDGVLYMFTVCDSIFCPAETNRKTEAETASDQHKAYRKSQYPSNSKFCVWKMFSQEERKAKQLPSPVTRMLA